MAITFTGFAQISPPSTPKAGTKQATTNQAYIYRSLTGDTTRLYLRLGASGITADYYEIGSGGSGSITSVTSANSDISVANPTTAPVLTLNSGYGVGQVAKFSVAPSSGIRLGWDAGLNNSIYTTPSNRYFYYDAGTASFGGHVFLVNSGQAALSIGSTKYVTMPILSTSGTPPSPIGTSKMVTTDANGTLSWANIPSAIGTVTSFGKVDGYGITSSVSNPTTTPVHTIAVDTAVIASRERLDSISSRVIFDRYGDSIVTNYTAALKPMYLDTVPANMMSRDGDKLILQYSGIIETDSGSDQYLRVIIDGQSVNFPNVSGAVLSTSYWDIKVTIIRISSSVIKVSSVASGQFYDASKVHYGTYSSIDFTSPIPIQLAGQQSVPATADLLKVGMAYGEFKPAKYKL